MEDSKLLFHAATNNLNEWQPGVARFLKCELGELADIILMVDIISDSMEYYDVSDKNILYQGLIIEHFMDSTYK